MKYSYLMILLLLGLVLAGLLLLANRKSERGSVNGPAMTIEVIKEGGGTMQLTSRAFKANETIPDKYTCDGANINPPLTIRGVPEGTKSLALIVNDPDAPSGDWAHWTVWNIAPEVEEIEENSVPEGAVEGVTDFGQPGYGGPCPPSGSHRYHFKVYALDVNLDLDASAKKAGVEVAMAGHILGETMLVGKYQRI